MEPDGINPLDLNNFPPDYTRDHGKHLSEEYSFSSSATADKGGGAGGNRDRKAAGTAVSEAAEKVYECRFCSLKFCKSQALGGHMNRHRLGTALSLISIERETEMLNKARELVFTNDVVPFHLCYVPRSGQSIPRGGFHHHQQVVAHNLCGESAAGLPFPSMYPPRMYSDSPVLREMPPYMYPSLSHHIPSSPLVNDYFFVGNYSFMGQGGLVSSNEDAIRDEMLRHDRD